MVIQSQTNGNYEQALSFGQEALSIARTLSDRAIEVVATSFLGSLHLSRGEFRDASALLEKNIALEGDLRFERFGTLNVQSAFSAGLIADALSEAGRFDEAVRHAETAVRIAEADNNLFSLYVGLLTLGLSYLRRGDSQSAIRVLERCRDLYDTWQDVLRTPVFTAALGCAYALANRADEAVTLVTGAVHYRPAFILLCAGMTYLWVGRIDEATSHAREALALTRRLGARGNEAHALYLSGEIASVASAEDAERYYRQTLALAEPRDMRPLVAHCHLGLGTIHHRMGNPGQAQEHLTIATAMYREMVMAYWLEQAEAELRRLG